MLAVRTPGGSRPHCHGDVAPLLQPRCSAGGRRRPPPPDSRDPWTNPSDGMLAVRTARAARREYMRDGEPVCEHLTARACLTWFSSLLSPVHAATNVPQMSCGRTLPCRTA